MSPVILRYPLDPSGQNINNLVQDENHVMVRRNTRVIATRYGAFFTESLVVTEAGTNRILTPGMHYYAAEMYELPTARYGKEICAIVVITDSMVADEVNLTYQALGGEYSTSATAIVQMLEALKLDDRPVGWRSLINKPSEYPPAQHLHDAGDTYGWEYMVHALERVKDAILIGDSSSHDAIYQYVDDLITNLRALANGTQASLTLHTDNLNNPHSVTKGQIGLGNVNNYGMASAAEAIDGLLNTKYLSPSLLKAVLDPMKLAIDTALAAHVGSTSNPHAVTKTQVGLSNVNNYGTASDAETITGTATNLHVTPKSVKAVTTPITDALTTLAATLNAVSTTLANKSDSSHSHALLVNGTAQATLSSLGVFVANEFQLASDETLKKDWLSIDNLIEKLAKVKYGSYEMIATGHRHYGVPAQSLEPEFPHAVGTNEDGIKSVAYGNLALVACIALANEVIALRSELGALKPNDA